MSLIEPNTTFYVVDCETTGFNAKENDAIQLAAIKVYNDNGEYKVVDKFNSYINPHYPLPPAIAAFNKRARTGIDDELLSQAPDADVVAARFAEFVGESPCVVFHNAPFDMSFIDKLLGCSFNADIVDTLDISRKHLTEDGQRHNLGAVFALSDKKYSSESPKFHNALGDVYATLDVLDYLDKTFYKSETLDLTQGQSDGRK